MSEESTMRGVKEDKALVCEIQEPLEISTSESDSRDGCLDQYLMHQVASEYRPITAEAINKTFERICHQHELNTQAGLYEKIHSETIS